MYLLNPKEHCRSLYKAYRRICGPILIVCHHLADSDLYDSTKTPYFVLPAHTELFQGRLYSL